MKFPRFKLRTLFLLVAVFAVASWAYWIGLPWWTIYREQSRFIESVKQLKPGMTIWQAAKKVRYGSHLIDFQKEYPPNTLMVGYAWPNSIYCIFYVAKGGDWSKTVDPDASMTKIEVFRLAPMPTNYKSTLRSSVPHVEYISVSDRYVGDFGAFITGDRTTNPGFKYELIYSDPPQEPEPKPSD